MPDADTAAVDGGKLCGGLVADLARITRDVIGGDFTSLRRVVEAAGGTWTEDVSGYPIAHTGLGLSVGIPVHGDPVGCFVQVAFAIAGQRWPEVPEFMQAMRIIQKEWSARTKVERETKANA